MSSVTKRIKPVESPAKETDETPTAAAPRAPEPQKKKRGLRTYLLMFGIPLLLAIGGGYYYLTGGRYVGTNNAYVHQPMVAISSDLPGRVVKVDVAENQTVTAGTPLFSLDPEPFQLALDQAKASLAAAELQVSQLRAGYETAKAKLSAMKNIETVYQSEYDRQKSLAGQGVTSNANLDQATLALRGAENNVTLAEQGVASAIAALGGDPNVKTADFPAVKAAQAQLDTAERNLRKTTVVAPVSGRVSQVANLRPGLYVAPGTTVASIVETGETWVDANFKETQLSTIKVGQPATVSVDAYPGVTLNGKVESISPATGAEFSLIPAQNATGNWVKVVQRLAVRIAVTPDGQHPLRDGMSAEASVDTGQSRLAKLK